MKCLLCCTVLGWRRQTPSLVNINAVFQVIYTKIAWRVLNYATHYLSYIAQTLLRSPNITGIKERETATNDSKVEIIVYCWRKAGMYMTKANLQKI